MSDQGRTPDASLVLITYQAANTGFQAGNIAKFGVVSWNLIARSKFFVTFR